MKFLFIVATSIAIHGCASFTSPARMQEMSSGASYWMDYDVTRRGTIVSAASSDWRSCAEPAPDAAIGLVAKLEGGLSLPAKADANAKGELTQSIVSLAEKTQMVLFLRESFFRLCELTLNTQLSADKTENLYRSVIDAALELVKKERAEIDLQAKRLEMADQAEFIYGFLSDRDVDQTVIQDLLKELP